MVSVALWGQDWLSSRSLPRFSFWGSYIITAQKDKGLEKMTHPSFRYVLDFHKKGRQANYLREK